MSKKVGYVYDEQMTKHEHPKGSHPEGPNRIRIAKQIIEECGLLEKMTQIPSRDATEKDLALVHSKPYIEKVKSYSSMVTDNPCALEENWPTYVSDHAYSSSICAVGSTLNLVDAVLTNQVNQGVSIVRPPGHHAEVDETSGFCFFNTTAIAAKYAQKVYGVKKVLILDWDIHHGNGIQHIFYEDSTVLYISLHRFDNGEYFPRLREANYDYVGKGPGEGFNVNIPWNKDMMGNSEYRIAFDRIILPISNQFKPDLILVASGFDAVAADPLGDYIVTHEIFAYMVERLKHLADGKLILVLEGGYNSKEIGKCLGGCVETLLGLRSTVLETGEPCKRALQTLSSVIQCQSKYWTL